MARASAARRAARQVYHNPKAAPPTVVAKPVPKTPPGPPVTDAEIADMMDVDIDNSEDREEVARLRRAVGPTADRAKVRGVIDTLRAAAGAYDDGEDW